MENHGIDMLVFLKEIHGKLVRNEWRGIWFISLNYIQHYRERVNIACSIIEALINDCDSTAEEVAVQFLDMIKNILTKKNRSLKNVSEEVINPKQRLISNGII